MKIAPAVAAPVLCLAAGLAHAQGGETPPGVAPEAPGWEFSATGEWNAPKGGTDFASGTFTADRGALHLEARANYEAIHAQSAFVGWTFSWGGAVKLEATPIAGGVGGSLRGPIAGLEATLSSGAFDYYLEAEHVSVRNEGESSYNYAWTELGWRPAEWLRFGAVGQHTRIYGGDRETQRGGFVQLTHGKATLSAYWFNPGTSDQVLIVSLGAAF
ncbi:MAG TPA: hypothetical protein VEG27_13890 [Usitatibacter sp.]|nr:hypothetical protein [Usitatibacter sp.]